jgi:hypothetical protein
MSKRTAPKPDAPIPAEAWFVDLISQTHITARALTHKGVDTVMAAEIERNAWANLARCCVAAPWEG